MKGFFDGLIGVFSTMHKMVRPYLTMFIATIYNIILAWAVFTGRLPVHDYMMSVAPINSMIIGFWFAEKAALKNPVTGQDSTTEK
jgi:hypothetical protein